MDRFIRPQAMTKTRSQQLSETTMRALKAIANRNPRRAAMARIHRESTLIAKAARSRQCLNLVPAVIRPST